MRNLKPSRQARQNRGFSLIELMIVIVIAGILAAIAFPSYSSYVVRSKRAAAYSCMTQISAVMEQVYADSFKFTVDLDGDSNLEFGNASGECSATGNDCESLDVMLSRGDSVKECADQVSSDYSLRLGSINSNKFSLIAEPVSDGFDPQCGVLTLKHNGKASAEGELGDDCFAE